MEHLFAGVVTCIVGAAVAVVLAVLCTFWRKKPTQEQAATSAELDDVNAEEGRKGFIFDDPYHYIDFSDDVKTLSSGTSVDSTFEDISPSDSGFSIQDLREEESSGGPGHEASAGSWPTSEGCVTLEEEEEEKQEEAVYEVIAFEQDGTVNHNPSTTAIVQAIQESEQNQPTYEDVEDSRAGMENDGEKGDETSGESGKKEEVSGESWRKEESESLPGGSRTQGDVVVTSGDDEDVFDEELYSPVYESPYVDCLSSNQRWKGSNQQRKDSVLEMVSCPAYIPNAPLTASQPPYNSAPASSKTVTSPAKTVLCETPSSDSQNGSSSNTPASHKDVSEQPSGSNTSETPETSSGKDGAKKGSKNKSSDKKPLGHWGSLKARISFFRKTKKKSSKSENESDAQQSSTHDNKAFEHDDTTLPTSSPPESAQTEDNEDTSPSASVGGAEVAQNSQNPTQTEVNDTEITSSPPSGAQVAQNTSAQATPVSSPAERPGPTRGRPFSYLTHSNSMSELARVLQACKDSTDRQEERNGTVTPTEILLSGLSDIPSQPKSAGRRAMSLRNVNGVNSVPNTPRSSSKPRPPVPPKPVCAK